MKATAIPRRVIYRLALPPERLADAGIRCEELLAQEKVWVNRLKPSPKKLNIRPYLRSMQIGVDVESAQKHTLILNLWVTQTGTARVDELLKLLDLADLPDAGSVIERVSVEIRDEVLNPDPADVPPAGPAEILPLDPAAIAALVRQEEEQAAALWWSVSPASAVVE
jgi:hypothetical protein